MARRAIREYASTPIKPSDLEAVLDAATSISEARLRHGSPPLFVGSKVAIAMGDSQLIPGVYEKNKANVLARTADFGRADMLDCFNQNSFGKCAGAMFTIADLGCSLAQRGMRGYREMAQHAGSIIGFAWLVSTSLGLVGSAAGGVIPAGLRRTIGADGFRECPLLALPFGNRISANTGEAQ
jgi:hypothetical protein